MPSWTWKHTKHIVTNKFLGVKEVKGVKGVKDNSKGWK
jgi:hypothetical protein